MIDKEDNIHKALEKIAVQFTQRDMDDINSISQRRKIGDALSSGGNIALLSSIPMSILAKGPGMARAANVAAIGGVGATLTGMGLRASSKSKAKSLRARKLKEMQKIRSMQMRKSASVHKDPYDDAYMLCKVLDSMAAQAIELKEKIAEGHQLPSWAEYKIYKAGDSIKSALGSTYSMKRRLMGLHHG